MVTMKPEPRLPRRTWGRWRLELGGVLTYRDGRTVMIEIPVREIGTPVQALARVFTLLDTAWISGKDFRDLLASVRDITERADRASAGARRWGAANKDRMRTRRA